VKIKYLAQLPGEQPKVVHASTLDYYYDHAELMWECPPNIRADKAREAIRFGVEAEAGIKLVWSSGQPVDPRETDEVPPRDREALRRASPRAFSRLFWDRVRDIRARALRPTWKALLEAVNEITGADYDMVQFVALVEGGLVDGKPVHERRSVGPVDLVALHRSPLLTLVVDVPHQWVSSPRLCEEGADGEPCVLVKIRAKQANVPSVIPRSRQLALGFADVHSLSLAFTPVVRTGPVKTFRDQEGRRRRGHEYEIMFPLTRGVRGLWPATEILSS